MFFIICSTKKNANMKNLLLLPLFMVIINCSAQEVIQINNNLQLQYLYDSTFVHISYVNHERWGRFSCNGLLFVKNGEGILVDTPIDSLTTKQLVKFIYDSLNVNITRFIACHYHNDNIGGLGYLHSIGVKTIANKQTLKECKERNLPLPQQTFTDSITINFNNELVKCYFLGSGHSVDNIVVYIEKSNVLFGGCMVKSMEANNLGNIAEADIEAWPLTINKLKDKFDSVHFVVPGHGITAGTEQFDHTLELLINNK